LVLYTDKTMKPSPALEISGLSLSIGGKEILKNVSFDVRQGAFLSIIGPNGAGKTTLLRCVMGMISSWTGDVRVGGQSVGSYRRRNLARLVSYVPQSDEMLFPFTGRELVLMGRYPHLSPFSRIADKDRRIVDHILQTTGTASLADRDIRTLSGGERQKIHIAGALAQEAGIMLLDEPTTFLDPCHTDEILSILTDLNEKGVTIVMITHDVNHAVHYGTSVTALNDGSVVFNGSSGDLMNNNVLKSVYGKNFILVRHPVSGKVMALPGQEQS